MWHTSALGLFVCRDFYLKTSVQHVMLVSRMRDSIVHARWNLCANGHPLRTRTRARSRCPRAGTQSLPIQIVFSAAGATSTMAHRVRVRLG